MEAIKEKLKKDWKFFLILIITIIASLLISFYSLNISDKIYRTSENIETTDYVQDVKQGTIIEQKIVAKENNFQRIDIEFEPFKERYDISGNIIITLKDQDGKNIKKKTITRNYIRENTVYEFEFKKQKKSEGKIYTLQIWEKGGIEFMKIK